MEASMGGLVGRGVVVNLDVVDTRMRVLGMARAPAVAGRRLYARGCGLISAVLPEQLRVWGANALPPGYRGAQTPL